MAKDLKVPKHISKAEDLVTSREDTRAGFVSMAFEKNLLAEPYVAEAKMMKTLSSEAKKPSDLLKIDDLRDYLIAASGLSDKALKFLTDEDKTETIKRLIDVFLEKAGENFHDELIYRYLLTKGDALGGKARNLAGVLGERKFLRAFLVALKTKKHAFRWRDAKSNAWLSGDEAGVESKIRAIFWTKNGKNRLMILNAGVPLVNKNVDLSILDATPEDLKNGKNSVIHSPEKYLALGELKGGIDPAGADEHWKTANSSLGRIRTAFDKLKLLPRTFFIGAAIENSMATEIFHQLENGKLSNAANLTNDDQLNQVCLWLADI